MAIYEPAEDSYLLSNALKQEIPNLAKGDKNLNFLDMGCGSGIVLQEAVKAGIRKENAAGADINSEAVDHCKKLGFNCIKSDLFQNIEGRFNIITFNPPYLPLDKLEPETSRRETTGGKKGNEIILRFLSQAKKHLASEGKIFLITSSLSEEVNFEKLGYKAHVIAMEKMFFEKIFAWILYF